MPSSGYERFERLRWNGAAPDCPHCEATGTGRFLAPGDGVRRTRTGAATERRVWRCSTCRRQFSVLTGTIFEGTRVALDVWLGVLAVQRTATDIAQRFGLTAETARTVLRRLESADASFGAGDAELARLLSLPAATVRRVRTVSAPRRRSQIQRGPTADYR